MKKKLLYIATALGAVAVIGASMASASQFTKPELTRPNLTPEIIAEHKAEMLAQTASLAGVDANTLQTELDAGRWLPAILQDLGVDLDTFHASMMANKKARMQEHMAEMVANGTITQDQADTRLERMQSDKMKMTGHHGFGKGLKTKQAQ